MAELKGFQPGTIFLGTIFILIYFYLINATNEHYSLSKIYSINN